MSLFDDDSSPLRDALVTFADSLAEATPMDEARLRAVAQRPNVSVVIPIFDAPEALRRCLISIRESHDYGPPCEVVMVDDHSDPQVAEVCERFADDWDNAQILRNERNLGFVGTVNRGMKAAASEHDVVLLNSDTVVTRGWLRGLGATAYLDATIATVCPLSNAAGVFSAPAAYEDGPLPEGLTPDECQRALSWVAPRLDERVPTTSGFCMWIKRAVLDTVGYFDELLFLRGYGEENDFNERARRAGYVHVVDDGRLVYHERGLSFGADKKLLKQKNSRILKSLHPRHVDDTKSWLASSRLDLARKPYGALAAALAQATPDERHLLVGDVPLLVALGSEREQGALVAEERRVVAARATDGSWTLDLFGLHRCRIPALPAETLAFLLGRRFAADGLETVGLAVADQEGVELAADALRVPHRAFTRADARDRDAPWVLPRTPRPNPSRSSRRDAGSVTKTIAASRLFDPVFYLRRYPEAAAFERGPLHHYVRRGVKALHEPNPLFDPVYYAAQAAIDPTDHPLLHYIRTGEAMGLRPHPTFDPAKYARKHPKAVKGNQLLLAQRLDAISAAQQAPTIPLPNLDRLSITVAVPIFNGTAHVRRCIESVLTETTLSGVELLLVDDASTDPSIAELLDGYAGLDGVTILRNAENLGFTRTVNRAFDHAVDRDVVLLNSDTVVGPRWLQELALAAYAQPEIASSTALSDSAGAFSTPEVGPNPTHEILPVTAVTRMSRRAASEPTHRVPTGNGFAMYIRRDALREVGGFDAERFPRGYGEENDWSMRARAKGLQHAIALRAYVHHVNAVSFGSAKERLTREAREVLDSLHPTYGTLVKAAFRGESALSRQRSALRESIRRTGHDPALWPRPRALFVVATRTGGTPKTNEDLMRGVQPLYEPFLLHCDAKRLTLGNADRGFELLAEHTLRDPIRMTPHTSVEYDSVVSQWLVDHDIELVHVRHIAWHSLGLVSAARRVGIPVVFSFHDFYTVCPSVNLTDGSGPYQPRGVTTSLAAPLWTKRDPDGVRAARAQGAEAFLAEWRGRMSAMLALCDAYVTTSETAKAILVDNFPVLAGRADAFHVIPHGRDFDAFREPTSAPRRGPLKVLLPGNISASKGLRTILELTRLMDPKQIELHLLGTADDELRHARGVVDHGGYRREEFLERVIAIDPHIALIPAVWPETFCHALTESWAAGIPVVGSELGAVGDRILSSGAGWTIDPHDARALHALLLRIRDDASEWRRCADAVTRWQETVGRERTVTSMAYDYGDVYANAMRRRRRFAAPRSVRPEVALAVRGHYPSASASVHIRIAAHVANASGRMDYRFIPPADLARAGVADHAGVVVCRNAASADVLNWIGHAARTADTPVVVDLDDNLLDIPSEKDPRQKYAPVSQALGALVRQATAVTVSTEPLLEELASATNNLVLVPNRLDARLWIEAAPPEPDVGPELTTPGEIRIVYMGSNTHDEDLALLLPAIRSLAGRHHVRLVIVGVTLESGTPQGVTRIVPPDSRYDRFVPWFRSLSRCFDLAVAPLVDTPFNRCKSDLKFMEYAACGLPVVASDVLPYRNTIRHEQDGLLAPNTTDAWRDALSRLLDDSNLRERMGAAARLRAEQELLVRSCAFDAIPWRDRTRD